VTALALVSGHMDVGAQVLLGSGLFGLWQLVAQCRRILKVGLVGRAVPCAPPETPGAFSLPKAGLFGSAKPVLRLTAGWLLGIMLAAPAILPLLEYTQTSARMTQRVAGVEERPPVGLAELPELVVPDVYGSSQRESYHFFPKGQPNVQESV